MEVDNTSSAIPAVSLNGADIILRSTDGVAFHLHKSRLRDASPHFRSMFAIAPPIPVDVQTVEIDLPGAVLWHLVRYLYVNEIQSIPFDASTRGIDDALTLVEAAQKLELDEVEKALIAGPLSCAIETEENPLRAWAIAKTFGLETKTSALRFFLSPTNFSDLWPKMHELKKIDAFSFNQIVKAHDYAQSVLRSVVLQILWPFECRACEFYYDHAEDDDDPDRKPHISGERALREQLKLTHPTADAASSPFIYILAAPSITCEECQAFMKVLEKGARDKPVGWHIPRLRREVLEQRQYDHNLLRHTHEV